MPEPGERARSVVLLTLLFGAHILVAACDDRRGGAPMAGPTAPTGSTSLPAASPGEFIRGEAQDSAFRPIPGAKIEILDGPQAGTTTTSDARGEFSLQGIVDDTTKFRASK